jgi:GxxExxY protein
MNGMLNTVEAHRSLDEALAKREVGVAMKVYRTLGGGFNESVYGKAMVLERCKSDLVFEQEKAFSVFYDGIEIGVFHADPVIDNRLIVELKSDEALHITHSVQLVNYPAAARIDFGLLLNFGTKNLEFKTKTRIYVSKEDHPNLQS